jgi:hypothetical protein
MARIGGLGRLAAVAGAASLSCAAVSIAPVAPTLPSTLASTRSTPIVVPAPMFAMASALSAPGATAPRVDPRCSTETHWDGIACAHPRATCGGWDGVTCEPGDTTLPKEEREAKSEFGRIDDETRGICPETDESLQVYSGTVQDVCRAIDVAIDRADAIGARLEQLRKRRHAPQWDVATYARVGSLYDCIWNSTRGATPALFTPQQQALMAKLGALAQGQNSAGQVAKAQQVQRVIADTRQQVEDKWRVTRDQYLSTLGTKMLKSYVTAALLARRYGLEGFELTRASQRLPIVGSILGDEAMSRFLADVEDPTDPEPDVTKRRHVVYAAGAFGVGP